MRENVREKKRKEKKRKEKESKGKERKKEEKKPSNWKNVLIEQTQDKDKEN